jgi:uncharacterized membrane protein YgdD (TMEM256/DUF423 family)
MKLFLFLAGAFGFLSVAIGAFGAHALKARISPEMLEINHTGSQYQMYHSLALLVVAIFLKFYPDSKFFNTAGWLFVAGIIIFSGSLYALSLTGIKTLGAITPIGGLCFLGAWACVLVGALKA